jgi:hypothetical protein
MSIKTAFENTLIVLTTIYMIILFMFTFPL